MNSNDNCCNDDRDIFNEALRRIKEAEHCKPKCCIVGPTGPTGPTVPLFNSSNK